MFKFLSFMLMLVCGVAVAEPIKYYGTPIYYSKFAPETFDCVYNKGASFGYCGSALYPEEGVVGYTFKDDPEHGEGAVVRLYTEVICLEGICETNYGERVGSAVERGLTYWYIPVGFYMDVDGNRTKVYKHGTGPSGDKYLMKNIKVLPEYQDPPRGKVQEYKDTLNRYDVYCNAADECSYMGRVMLASQLSRFIPKVMTHSCDRRFCYNPDKTIAGLNPKLGTESLTEN